MAAKIITGTYVEQVATVKPADEQTANFVSVRMERNLQTGTTLLTDRTPVSATLSEVQSYEAGSTHYMAEPDYHYTPVSSGSLLVTLCLMSPTLSKVDRFLRPVEDQVPPQEPLRPHLDGTDIETIWWQVQEAREALAV